MTCIAPPDARAPPLGAHARPRGFDGPVVDADIAAIERELGVREPPNVPPKDQLILRGAAALGHEVGRDAAQRRSTAATAAGAGSAAGAAPSSPGCGSTSPRRGGTGRGSSPTRRSSGSSSRAGARAGVEATVVVDGRPRRLVVRAPAVVVAAGALRTPVVLLRSGIDHPAMGRHLRLHPVVDPGRVPRRGRDDVARDDAGGAVARAPRRRGADGDGGGFIVESAPGTPGLIGLVFPWEGRAAFRDLMGEIRHVAPLIAITADRGGGRVAHLPGRPARGSTTRSRPRTGARSRRGSPTAPGSPGRAARGGWSRVGTPPAWFAATGGAGDAAAFAAYEARLRDFDFRPNRGTVASAHQMGSARAGGPGGDYPCDPWGRVRTADARPGRDATIPGLYVGDASLFPTAIGVNPMITTMVWARRVARTVLAETAARLSGQAAGPAPGRPSDLELDRARPAPRRGAGCVAAPRGDDQHDGRDDHDAWRRASAATAAPRG